MKSCGPDASTPASSSAEACRPDRVRLRLYPLDDGDKKARSPGRVRDKPLKPLRREGRANSANPAVTTLVWFYFFPREAAGAASTRLSLRPLFSGATVHAQLGRFAPRGGGGVSTHSSLPAKAGDPVFQRRRNEIERPRRTGYPPARGMTAWGMYAVKLGR